MSQTDAHEINKQSSTEVFDAKTGERILVPWGKGLPKPDRDNLYCHQWSDQMYYKFPEKPGTGFSGIVDPPKMFLSELAALSDEEALRSVQDERNALRVSEDLLRFCIATGISAFLWGPPGHAKTAFIEGFQHQRDENGRFFNTESEELGQIDATVINGIHYVHPSEYTMNRSIPEVAQNIIGTYRETGRLTVYLMDEITLSGTGQQGAALRALTHGEMGPVSIKNYAQIVIAGNPKSTVKRANDLLESAINRGAHFAWKMDAETWYPRWKRGFVPEDMPRDPEKEPDSWTRKFARELLSDSPSGVAPFESSYDDNWTRENLVPKKRELSPRTLNDFLKGLPMIRRVCSEVGVTTAVCDHYIYALSRAMFSDKWSQSVVSTLARMSNAFGGYDEIAERVTEIDFTTQQMPAGYAESLLRLSSGQPLGFAEVGEVMDEARALITNRSSTAHERTRALVVAWSVAVAAQHTHAGHVPVVVNALADMAQYLANNKHLLEGMPEKIVPPFVSTTLHEQLRETLSSRA